MNIWYSEFFDLTIDEPLVGRGVSLRRDSHDAFHRKLFGIANGVPTRFFSTEHTTFVLQRGSGALQRSRGPPTCDLQRGFRHVSRHIAAFISVK